MSKRRSRQSKRRLKSIFMMVILTALLSIASTYAWFSANRIVSLTGITAKVSAAEGLQISLDGEIWSSSVEISPTTLEEAAQKVRDAITGGSTESAPVYSWPTELTPVSTAGQTNSGRLVMKYGNISADGRSLTDVATESDQTTTKYIAFDMYLKNSSSQVSDLIQLATNSKMTITDGEGVAGTGLEYSPRIGFVFYANTAAMTATGPTVRSLAYGTPTVAIWEPSYNLHIGSVVDNDRRITSGTTVFQTLGVTEEATGVINQVDTNLTSVNGGIISGAYYEAIDLNGDDDVIDAGETVGSPNTAIRSVATLRTGDTIGADTTLISTASNYAYGAGMEAVAENLLNVTIAGNKITKVRVYIWLEGQDPDCNDTASTGKSLDIAINLTKPVVENATVATVSLPEFTYVIAGGTTTLTPVVLPNGASTTVTWTTSNDAVATVAAGVVSVNAAATEGQQAIITATSTENSTKYARCTIVVGEPVTTVTVTPSTQSIAKGGTASLSASATGDNTPANTNVTWSSNNPKVTVSSTGEVSVAADAEIGEVIITATSVSNPTVSNTCTVTVTEP